MAKKHIVMTMIEVGFGHKAPAKAVKEAMEELWPGEFQIDVVDFAKEVGATATDKLIKDGWDFALAFPLTGRIGYVFMELNRRNLGYIDVIYRDFIEKGIAYIAKKKPALVFATHPLCLYIACKAREALALDLKIIAYVVDPFDGYSLWADEKADQILVASQESRIRLIEHGIPDSAIRITGFPINRKFFDVRRSREEISAELGLLPDLPTILVSAGGQGIGKVFSYIEAITRLMLPFNIITVAGKNARTKKRMDKLAVSFEGRVKLVSLGYVTNMNELLSVSDIVVGKSGASTFMEAVFMGKPVIFTEWATYNDWYIVNFAQDKGIGWYCPSVMSFVSVLRTLSNPGILDPYKQKIRELGLKPGAEEVALYLKALLESGRSSG